MDKPSLPSDWKTWTFWQYQGDVIGKVKGISGEVDLNRFNGSLDDLHKFASNCDNGASK